MPRKTGPPTAPPRPKARKSARKNAGKSATETAPRSLTLVPDAPPVTAEAPAEPQQPVLIPVEGGRGALWSGGVPGNRGGGRPKDAFKAMCRELASSDNVYTVVEMILANPFKFEALYLGALKWATEQGYGKATETVETNTTVTVKQEWTWGSKKVAF